jgi:hypothetical protein
MALVMATGLMSAGDQQRTPRLRRLQAAPVILSSDDIGDNYYDARPAEIRERASWLGLFIEGKPDQVARKSRLAVTRVSFVRKKEPGPTVYQLVTTPPGAELLLSGVPRLSAGTAFTASENIDLGGPTREAELSLGKRRYRIRLDSKESNSCDAVITLIHGDRKQKLFDAAEPGRTNDPALVLSCDEPHFTVHWAGDLDRDGQLDMVASFSRKYSYHPNQLFLSSGAKSGELVAEVARYDQFAR